MKIRNEFSLRDALSMLFPYSLASLRANEMSAAIHRGFELATTVQWIALSARTHLRAMTKGFIICLLLMTSSANAVVQEVPQANQLSVDVTLYEEGVALVKETREADLITGSNKLLIKGVPNSILTDSVVFQSVNPPADLKVKEYSFLSPHISREMILSHSIGKQVLIFPSKVKEAAVKATLLSLDGDNVIIQSQGMIFAVKKSRVAFSQLPFTLTSEPVIVLKLDSAITGKDQFEVGYLAHGFTWEAGYTIIVEKEGGQLDFNSWINIHNKSGMSIKKGLFRIANLQSKDEKNKDGGFYQVDHPLSISDLAVKNISWFSAEKLKPHKTFRIYPMNDILKDEEGVVMKPSVETWLSVQNTSTQGLGIPLPQGLVKVFKRKGDGALFYIGESQTPPTLVGQAFSFRLGSTRDIVAEMHQTDYRKLGTKVVESGYRLDLKNVSASPMSVTVFQEVKAGEWVVLRETHPHEDAKNRIEWKLSLKPKEEVSLRYRIRMNVE